MEMPHEIIVWYVLPSLRKALVTELKGLGMPQKDIAKLMKITEASVSQYLHNKRGSKDIRFGQVMQKQIKKSALKIRSSSEKNIVMKELIKLVALSSKEKIVCSKCQLKNGKCEICHIKY